VRNGSRVEQLSWRGEVLRRCYYERCAPACKPALYSFENRSLSLASPPRPRSSEWRAPFAAFGTTVGCRWSRSRPPSARCRRLWWTSRARTCASSAVLSPPVRQAYLGANRAGVSHLNRTVFCPCRVAILGTVAMLRGRDHRAPLKDRFIIDDGLHAPSTSDVLLLDIAPYDVISAPRLADTRIPLTKFVPFCSARLCAGRPSLPSTKRACSSFSGATSA